MGFEPMFSESAARRLNRSATPAELKLAQEIFRNKLALIPFSCDRIASINLHFDYLCM